MYKKELSSSALSGSTNPLGKGCAKDSIVSNTLVCTTARMDSKVDQANAYLGRSVGHVVSTDEIKIVVRNARRCCDAG